MNTHLSYGKKLGALVALIAFCVGCACNGGGKPSNCSACPTSPQAKPATPLVPVFFGTDSLLKTKTAQDTIATARTTLANQGTIIRAEETKLLQAVEQLERQKGSLKPTAYREKVSRLGQWQQEIAMKKANLAKQLDAVAAQQVEVLGAKALWFARSVEGNSKDPFAILRQEAALLIAPSLKVADWTSALTEAVDKFSGATTPPANLTVPKDIGTMRVAFLQMEGVFQGTRAGRARLQKVAAEEFETAKKLDDRGKALQARFDDFKKQAPSMAKGEVAKRQDALRTEYEAITNAQQGLAAQSQTRRAELFKPLEDRVRLVLRELASQGLFDFVLLSSAVYFPAVPPNDVTQSVIQYIEQDTPLSSPTQPASLSDRLGSLHIVVVDRNTLFQTSKWGQALLGGVKEKAARKQKELQQKAAALESDENVLRAQIAAGTVAPRDVKKRAADLEKRQADLAQASARAQQEIATEETAAVSELTEKMKAAIAALDPNCLVFSSNAVAYEGGLPDITTRVKEKMDSIPIPPQNSTAPSQTPTPAAGAATSSKPPTATSATAK